MLQNKYRLKNRMAFTATYKQKKVVSDEFLILYLGKEKKDIDFPTKVGFVVSKKFHKRAVKRNKIKRFMREAYRLSLKSGEVELLQRYMSLIFMPKNSALGADFKTIQNSLKNLLKKLS